MNLRNQCKLLLDYKHFRNINMRVSSSTKLKNEAFVTSDRYIQSKMTIHLLYFFN